MNADRRLRERQSRRNELPQKFDCSGSDSLNAGLRAVLIYEHVASIKLAAAQLQIQLHPKK